MDKAIRALLDTVLARYDAPGRGEPGYECPHHGPSSRCFDCATDDELDAALAGAERRPWL